MSDIVKNLNYSADEINSILASVSSKASTTDLESTQSDLNKLTSLFNSYAASKTTLAEYGITDAKIEKGTITLGGETITPTVKSDLDNLETKLMELITKLQNRLDIDEAPDSTLVDSEGAVVITKDEEYFITK